MNITTTSTVQLDDATLDAIAQRVAAILAPAQSPQPEPWLTTEQAAKHLGVSVASIYQLIHDKSKGFPVHKLGSRNTYRASELDQWIDEGTHR